MPSVFSMIIYDLGFHETILRLMKLRFLTLLKIRNLVTGSPEVTKYRLTPKPKLTEHFTFNCWGASQNLDRGQCCLKNGDLRVTSWPTLKSTQSAIWSVFKLNWFYHKYHLSFYLVISFPLSDINSSIKLPKYAFQDDNTPETKERVNTSQNFWQFHVQSKG